MPSTNCKVLLLCQLLVSVGWGQSIVDVSPSEFPYVVKVSTLGSTYPYTEAAAVISNKYVLGSIIVASTPASSLTVTDRSGVVRPVARVQSILSGFLGFLKVCEKFEGATIPMTASSFNDLSADVNSTGLLLFYNASSHVLRKLPASAQKTASCPTSAGGKFICMYQDPTPGFCSFVSDTEVDASRTYFNLALISFGTQVQGYLATINCNYATGTMTNRWLFFNYGFWYQSIINAIP